MANNPWFLSYDEVFDQLQSFLPPSWRATLPGKVLGRLLVAFSLAVESLYALLARVLRLAIIATSEGKWLRALVEGFGMVPYQGVSATATVRFGMWRAKDAVVTVPANVRVGASTGVIFQAVEAGVIPIGETFVDVQCRCTQPGAQGNVAAGEINSQITALPGIDWVQNPNPALGGAAPESDIAIKTRLPGHIASLHRATIPATEFAPLNTDLYPDVLGFVTYRNYGTPGYVRAILTDYNGGDSYRPGTWQLLGNGVYYVSVGRSMVNGLVAAGYPGIRFGTVERDPSGAEIWQPSNFVAEVEQGDWRWCHDLNTGRLYARADGRDLNDLDITIQHGTLWRVQQDLERSWIGNGIRIDVLRPFVVRAAIALSYSLEEGYIQLNVENALRQAVSSYIGGLNLGENFEPEGFYAAVSVVAGAGGVLLTTPSGNISVPADSVFRQEGGTQITRRSD